MGQLATALVLLFTHIQLSAEPTCKTLANQLNHQNLESRYIRCLIKSKADECSTQYCVQSKYVKCLEDIYKHQLRMFLLMKKRNCFHQKVSFQTISDSLQ